MGFSPPSPSHPQDNGGSTDPQQGGAPLPLPPPASLKAMPVLPPKPSAAPIRQPAGPQPQPHQHPLLPAAGSPQLAPRQPPTTPTLTPTPPRLPPSALLRVVKGKRSRRNSGGLSKADSKGVTRPLPLRMHQHRGGGAVSGRMHPCGLCLQGRQAARGPAAVTWKPGQATIVPGGPSARGQRGTGPPWGLSAAGGAGRPLPSPCPLLRPVSCQLAPPLPAFPSHLPVSSSLSPSLQLSLGQSHSMAEHQHEHSPGEDSAASRYRDSERCTFGAQSSAP